MKPGAALLIVLLGSGAVQAQDSGNEKLCKSDRSEYFERKTACTALIDSGQYDDQAWVFERRADNFKDDRLYALSLDDFDRSLAIDPDYVPALKGRALSNVNLGAHEEALKDTERLVVLEPDHYWNHYIHGAALSGNDRKPEALAALDRSIALRGDYSSSWWKRANLQRIAGNFELAIADFTRARDLRPFQANTYVKLGEIYQELENPDLAAHNYRIALTLDPNLGRIEYRLNELVQLQASPTLPPLAYNTPKDGLELEYLQVVLPRDKRDEMTQSIMAIAAWFKPAEKAKPEAKALISRTLSANGDIVTVGLKLTAENNMDKFTPPGASLPESVEAYRGFFLTEIRPRGMDGPVFQVAYDGADPGELWPLKVANEVVGKGRALLICPKTFQFESMVLGCRIGMEHVVMGTLEYSLFVEKVENIHVPLGKFTSYVVRYRERATSEVAGQQKSREIETKWWVVPELDFWVKRTSQLGDKISVLQAIGMAGN